MKDVIFLLFQLLSTLAQLIQPGGSRAIIVENLLFKQELIINNEMDRDAIYLVVDRVPNYSECCSVWDVNSDSRLLSVSEHYPHYNLDVSFG